MKSIVVPSAWFFDGIVGSLIFYLCILVVKKNVVVGTFFTQNNISTGIGNLVTLFPFYSLPLIMTTPLIFSLVSINILYQNPYPRQH